jgi:hypothetical protein
MSDLRAATKRLGAMLRKARRRLFVPFALRQNRRAVTLCRFDLD